MFEHCEELVFGREVDANLQPSCVSLLDASPPAVTARGLVHDIARHLATRHCFGECEHTSRSRQSGTVISAP